MSTYYDFMVEAKYDGIWRNIDFCSVGADGRMHHHYLASIPCGSLGLLAEVVHASVHISFGDLSESTQKALLEDAAPCGEDGLKLNHYFVLGDLRTLERIADRPYRFEGYVTENSIALYESGETEDLADVLTAQQLLELPEEVRHSYVLYRWDPPFESRAAVGRMVDRAREQIERFNNSIPRKCDTPADERSASAVRILCALS